MQKFQLGPYLVEPSKGTILRDGENITIEPKAMAVLCELHSKQGQVVSQQDLFDVVWPGRVFSPSSLQRVIAIIRKALNETSQKPNFIFTHPKLGYRLELPQNQASQSELTSSSQLPLKFLKLFIGSVLLLLLTIGLYESLKTPAETLEGEISGVPIKVTKVRQVTHGEAEEFNSKLSQNGKWLSYQSELTPSRLSIVKMADQISSFQVELESSVIDHVWRGNSILAITKTVEGRFQLEQISVVGESRSLKVLAELEQWLFVDELQIDHGSKLWFVGKNNDSTYNIVQYDIISGISRNKFTLGKIVTEVSLAYSEHGLYFHYFNGTEKLFGRIKSNSDVELLDIETPIISDITWHNDSQSLIVSNQLIAEQFKYRGGKLSKLTLSTDSILTELFANNNQLSATKIQPDMDIVNWQYDKGEVKSNVLINSKFSDYQATKNQFGDIVYLSTRHGYPQVFIQTQYDNRMVFGNSEKYPFIPPMLWSKDGEHIVLIVNKSIFLLNIKTGEKQHFTNIKDAQQLFSWSGNDLVYLTESGDTYQYKIDSQVFELIKIKNAKFIGVDPFDNYFGATDKHVFWAEKSQPLSLGVKGRVKYAFSSSKYLVLQTEQLNGSRLMFVDDQLNVVVEMNLPPQCHYVTSAELSKDKASFLCTQLGSNDGDIVLFKID